MKRSFALAASTFGGPLLVTPLPRKAQTNKTIFYYRSISQFARDVRNCGLMKFVNFGDENVHYTHKNESGTPPTRDSALVGISFGGGTLETLCIIDRLTYDAYQARIGQKTMRKNVVFDREVASLAHNDNSLRPDVKTTPFADTPKLKG